MRKLALLFVLIATGFLTLAQSLNRQVFELGNGKADCQIAADCECCTSEILFLTEQKFAMINRCTYSDDTITGTYKITSDNLTLSFKSSVVTAGQRETDGKNFMTKKVRTLKPRVLKISQCEDGKTMLEVADVNDDKTFGLSRKGLNMEMRIKDFLNSKEWKLLNK